MPASLYGWSGPSLLTFVLSLSSCSRNELRRPDPYFSILALGSIWIRISRHGSQLRTFFDESLIAVPPTQRRGRSDVDVRRSLSLCLSFPLIFPLTWRWRSSTGTEESRLNEYFLGIGFRVGVPEEETRVKLLGDHRHLVATLTRLLWVGAIGG